MKMKVFVALLLLALVALPVMAQDGMNNVSFNGISFAFDPALASNVNISTFPGDPVDVQQPGGPEVAHTEFLLYSGQIPPSSWEGVGMLRFYRVSSFEGYEFPSQQLTQLQTLLAERPDLAQFMTAAEDQSAITLPFMPVFPASQVIRARAHYIDGAAVAGVAYVTAYRQDASPLVAREFMYTFQGLSNDGQYYVAATFPIVATMFPENLDAGFDPEAFVAEIINYFNQSIEQLNSAAPDAFVMPLDVYDALIQTITFGAGGGAEQPPVALTPVTAPTLPPPAEATPDAPETSDPTLGGLAGTWQLVSYGDPANPTPVIEGVSVTVSFTTDGVSGNAGCNSYGGFFAWDNNQLTITDVFSTLMACEAQGVMEQETVFLDALSKATSFQVADDGTLQIQYDGGVLNFTAAE